VVRRSGLSEEFGQEGAELGVGASTEDFGDRLLQALFLVAGIAVFGWALLRHDS
jgi:hypothetical protein